jgi:hypothetical protein
LKPIAKGTRNQHNPHKPHCRNQGPLPTDNVLKNQDSNHYYDQRPRKLNRNRIGNRHISEGEIETGISYETEKPRVACKPILAVLRRRNPSRQGTGTKISNPMPNRTNWISRVGSAWLKCFTIDAMTISSAAPSETWAGALQIGRQAGPAGSQRSNVNRPTVGFFNGNRWIRHGGLRLPTSDAADKSVPESQRLGSRHHLIANGSETVQLDLIRSTTKRVPD